ncbi:ABC transporter ATP-binding protein [Geosporobacter ferrireducens]|uniref:Oligopeptide ABC transporter ATP-binding protein OppF n=1 Tax=Geosporobacter ferrireducens TaxID=1424294 RepID=A0A1D8GMK4_9FIRM|nr:oligopeptide/dipeptide ABC transporter ATP-binding protein [Geosporobacter ferrireducens]AOT72062.1 oligopeptide ABC transporter ATP-binding protein OppF [Geosporobacter ferrireducens]
MRAEKPYIEVKNLKKYFKLSRKETLKAVDDVSFIINKGETVGLVGESGCGKSTTGRCLVKLYEPTDGKIFLEGNDIRLFDKKDKSKFCKKVQMIFQNPYASLNPRMTISEIIGEGIKEHHTISDKELKEQVYSLLELVGLNKEHVNRFPHEFSGGQRQRIGIARALSVKPEFIVCDEPISALDVSIQAQVVNMLLRFQRDMGLTYLFIAHDLSMVKYVSHHIAVMYLGSIVEYTDSSELYRNPVHPYTKALLSSIPIADPNLQASRRRIIIEGDVPSPVNPPDCCKFVERCKYAKPACFESRPVLKEISDRHYVACLLY